MAYALYAFAALAEIAGCFAVWMWWREGASAYWLIPGALALAVFAFLLALTPTDAAGRSFAAYAGVYLGASLLWLRFIDGQTLLTSDVIGAVFGLLGAVVIIWGAS
jgi:small multidrug resistance family-3 protein